MQSHYWQCQHPKWVPVCVPAALLLVWEKQWKMAYVLGALLLPWEICKKLLALICPSRGSLDHLGNELVDQRLICNCLSNASFKKERKVAQ